MEVTKWNTIPNILYRFSYVVTRTINRVDKGICGEGKGFLTLITMDIQIFITILLLEKHAPCMDGMSNCKWMVYNLQAIHNTLRLGATGAQTCAFQKRLQTCHNYRGWNKAELSSSALAINTVVQVCVV